MFWETKLAELNKIGTVIIEIDDPEGQPVQWRVTLGHTTFKGPTKAAAVVELWNHVTKEPFHIGEHLVRWNGRWEEVDPPKEPEPELPVVEESDGQAFDPAD